MITEHLPQLLLAWSILAVGVASPGPSVALILGVATRDGRVPSLLTAFGVSCASLVMAIATVLGLAVIFAQMAELMTVIRFLGAAYLFWLALKALRKAATPGQLDLTVGVRQAPAAAAVTGFLLHLANPKAILFWLAIASIGGVGNAPAPIVALFVATCWTISFAGHGAYALLLSSGPVRRAYVAVHRWIEGVLGCVFLFASFKLATEKL